MVDKKIKAAAEILIKGGVVAFPTETVFGLGALLNQTKAIKKIFAIKKRPKNKPLQILVPNLVAAKKLGRFNKQALALAKKYWPGPLTLVVNKTNKVSKIVTAGSSKVGLRVPKHKTILALLKVCGPLAATSANLSGQAPALSHQEINLKGIDYILPGKARLRKASQVIDATSKANKILRQ